jgi:hypothetical protein
MLIKHLFAIMAVIVFKKKKEACSTATVCREVWGHFCHLLVSTIGSLWLLFVNDIWSVCKELLISYQVAVLWNALSAFFLDYWRQVNVAICYFHHLHIKNSEVIKLLIPELGVDHSHNVTKIMLNSIPMRKLFF